MRPEDFRKMTPDELRKLFEQKLKEVTQLIKDVASISSAARLLAEDEPFGHLVMYPLLDDGLANSPLWVYLKMISDWLKETEERYNSQFPEDFPKTNNRYDLSSKPVGFRSRLDIFKEIVEKAESSELWDTQLIVNDPVAIVKTLRREVPPQKDT